MTLPPWEYLFQPFNEVATSRPVLADRVASLILLVAAGRPVQRPDPAAPPPPAVPRPVRVAAVDRPHHVQPAARVRRLRVRLHLRPGHDDRRLGDPASGSASSASRRCSRCTSRKLARQRYFSRSKYAHPEATIRPKARPAPRRSGSPRPSGSARRPARSRRRRRAMEILRFGVGHRRPGGAGRHRRRPGRPVIHADARGVVTELAFARNARDRAAHQPEHDLVRRHRGRRLRRASATRPARVSAGEAVLWPAGVPHAAWTDLSEMRAIVVEFAGADDARAARDPRRPRRWRSRPDRRPAPRAALVDDRLAALRPRRGRARLSVGDQREGGRPPRRRARPLGQSPPSTAPSWPRIRAVAPQTRSRPSRSPVGAVAERPVADRPLDDPIGAPGRKAASGGSRIRATSTGDGVEVGRRSATATTGTSAEAADRDPDRVEPADDPDAGRAPRRGRSPRPPRAARWRRRRRRPARPCRRGSSPRRCGARRRSDARSGRRGPRRRSPGTMSTSTAAGRSSAGTRSKPRPRPPVGEDRHAARPGRLGSGSAGSGREPLGDGVEPHPASATASGARQLTSSPPSASGFASMSGRSRTDVARRRSGATRVAAGRPGHRAARPRRPPPTRRRS